VGGIKRKFKVGEKVVFGFALLVACSAIAMMIRHGQSHAPVKPRDYYDWTQAGLDGHLLYRSMGCNNCHRAMGVGEVGLAPVLDGSGTRHTLDWLQRYFQDPSALVEGRRMMANWALIFAPSQQTSVQVWLRFYLALKPILVRRITQRHRMQA
jgi:cbb3-type cytochrome oxidase cytochrome c subunit